MCGCMGVLVTGCFFLFRLVRLSPYQSHAAQRDTHWSPHAMIRSLRSRMVSCEGFVEEVHFRNGRILRLSDRRADGDVRRPGRSAIRGLARDERS